MRVLAIAPVAQNATEAFANEARSSRACDGRAFVLNRQICLTENTYAALFFSGIAQLSETDKSLWWEEMNVGEGRPLMSSDSLSAKAPIVRVFCRFREVAKVRSELS